MKTTLNKFTFIVAMNFFAASLTYAVDTRVAWDAGGDGVSFTDANNWDAFADPGASNELPGYAVDTGNSAAILQGASVNPVVNSVFNAANQFDGITIRADASLTIQADMNLNNSQIFLHNSNATVNHNSGTVQASNLTIVDNATADYNLSGGTLNLATAMSVSGTDSTFSLQGDTASVSVGTSLTLGANATLDFQFGATGINAIDVTSGSFVIDAASLLTIDGSSYSGDHIDYTLVDSINYSGSFSEANISITGFAPTYTTEVIQGVNGDLILQITVTAPEPGTLGLLAIGSALLFNTRRRKLLA